MIFAEPGAVGVPHDALAKNVQADTHFADRRSLCLIPEFEEPRLMSYLIEAIGYVAAQRRTAEDDFWGSELATIRLTDAFASDALQGIADFSHVEVLYLFHAVEAEKVVTGARHPRNNANWPAVGIFSQRGKNRPNRIGSTICRLLTVRGTQLVVAELDAIDGTPVLDIKPVMAEFLPREPIRQPGWSRELMANYWRPSKQRQRLVE